MENLSHEKIENLKAVNVEITKKEKKAFKKLRQKAEKNKAENISVGESLDDNDNFLDKHDYTRDSPIKQSTPARTKVGSPVRSAPGIPSTPVPSYTPPGLPAYFSSELATSTATLSTYFKNTAADNNFYTEPFDMKEYIQSISKITLLPSHRRKEEN